MSYKGVGRRVLGFPLYGSDNRETSIENVKDTAMKCRESKKISTFKFFIFEKLSCFIVLVVFLVIVQSSELIYVLFCVVVAPLKFGNGISNFKHFIGHVIT